MKLAAKQTTLCCPPPRAATRSPRPCWSRPTPAARRRPGPVRRRDAHPVTAWVAREAAWLDGQPDRVAQLSRPADARIRLRLWLPTPADGRLTGLMRRRGRPGTRDCAPHLPPENPCQQMTIGDEQ
jgi:hypothetical protein